MTPPETWVLWLAAVLVLVAMLVPAWVVALVARRRAPGHRLSEIEQVVTAEGHADNRATYRPAARPRRSE